MKQINQNIEILGDEIHKAFLKGLNGLYHMRVDYADGVNVLTPNNPPRAGVYRLVIRRADCCDEHLTVQVPGCQPHATTHTHTASSTTAPIPTCTPETDQ